ncbi:MAG: SCP-like extracellular [Ruminococcus sp.]|nr:SCP-like extracellular [Ruminococcus sp.]MDE6779915.1 SCP-like extracellular [Ruminococcus sp.]
MKKMNIFKRVITALTTAMMAVTASGITFNVTASNEEPDFNEMAERIVYLVNEARQEAGLEPIYIVPYLSEIATVRAEECVESFSHTRTNGESFKTVIDYEQAPWASTGENIAAGMSTPEGTFEQWKNSPSHWAAIMSPDYTHMGVGIAYDPDSTYKWYWQQLFIKVDTYEKPDGVIEGQYIPDEYSVIPQATGDLTGDGIVDSFDFVLLCRYLNKQVTLNPLQIESADILKDGVVSYSDAAFLRKYILGDISEIPVKLF